MTLIQDLRQSALEVARAVRRPEALALKRSQVTTARLQVLRDQASETFEQALFQMEEMSSTVTLIRFAEHSEEEVADCLLDLSSRVEGITEGILATSPKLV